ncbi:MAG TPA: aldo/keto reductase, partial [Candidatus Hydrogenedentes bacterium]|nr:aldo/keto reductase [Candidatus Hydrogenedentota bacterium]
IGFGGILVAGVEQDHANRVVAESIERGVDYFDVAPSYGDAEIKLGPALEPYRKDAFLACKTAFRDRAGGEKEFEQSLERLRTGYFDLYQLHGIVSVEKDVDPAFAEDGVMAMITERKKAGQIRYVGFTAHTVEAAFAAMERYDFDSMVFPVNFACHFKGAFGLQALAKAQEKGVARMAIKAMARQQWPADDPNRAKYKKCWYEPTIDPEEASMALRWTLSQPITAAIPPGEESLFRLALDIASGPTEITPHEEEKLETLARSLNPIFALST